MHTLETHAPCGGAYRRTSDGWECDKCGDSHRMTDADVKRAEPSVDDMRDRKQKVSGKASPINWTW